MSSSYVRCQVWMGGVEYYMNEAFIMSAFQRMGENPLTVKLMRNRVSGEIAGYCFVHFTTDEEAINVIHKLNGKLIPNSTPPSRFRLNHATSNGRANVTGQNYSLWVGELSPDVDDYQLYKTFASRYESVRVAKVEKDLNGQSKGCGFVQFANEEEKKNCQLIMNGFKGLGTKSLKISSAVPKAHRLTSNTTVWTGGYRSSNDCSQQCEPPSYWQSYSSWHTSSPHTSLPSLYPTSPLDTMDDLELIDHNAPLDVDSWNKELMERDYNMWDALESSKWLPLETFG